MNTYNVNTTKMIRFHQNMTAIQKTPLFRVTGTVSVNNFFPKTSSDFWDELVSENFLIKPLRGYNECNAVSPEPGFFFKAAWEHENFGSSEEDNLPQ